MKRINTKIVFYSFIWIFQIWINVDCYSQYCKPIYSFPDSSFGFKGVNPSYPGFHNGTDFPCIIESSVKAIKDGKITLADDLNGFGGIITGPPRIYIKGGCIVIKHINDNGKAFYAIYGHINRNLNLHEGDTVFQGQEIGKILRYTDNNVARIHLHFGINIGLEPPKTNLGYCDVNELIKWAPPYYYLNTYCGGMTSDYNQNIGQFEDGWHENGESQVFVNAYVRNGGFAKLGNPVDHENGGIYVHYYPLNFNYCSQVLLQDFSNGTTQTTLCCKLNAKNAFLLKGAIGFFWWQTRKVEKGTYKIQDLVGAPVSDESNSNDASFDIMQEFENGYIFWNNTTKNVRVKLKNSIFGICDCALIEYTITKTGNIQNTYRVSNSAKGDYSTCDDLFGNKYNTYSFWDFNSIDGKMGWQSQYTSASGISMDWVWHIVPDNSGNNCAIVSPVNLIAVNNTQFGLLEIRLKIDGLPLSVLNSYILINGQWKGPIPLNHIGGDSNMDVYSGNISSDNISNSGQIQQLKIEFINDPSKNIYIDYVKFIPRNNSTNIISGYIKDASNNGVSGVTVNFSNGISSTNTDINGYYSQSVSNGISCTVTPSKNNYSFSPSSVNINNISSNQAQNFTAINSSGGNILSQTFYAETGDGGLMGESTDYLTAHNSNAAGKVYSGLSYMSVGQEFWTGGYVISRALIPFNTSSLPSNATITNATLYLNAHHYTTDINFEIYVVSADMSTPYQISSNDYSKIGSTFFGYKKSDNITIDQYTDFILNPNGCNYVKKGSWTILGLRSYNDLNSIPPTGRESMGFYPAEFSNYKPYLTIQYIAPPPIVISVFNPNPSNGANNINKGNVNLNWQGSVSTGNSADIQYQVKFGTSPNSMYIQRNWSNTTNISINSLQSNTTYYWQISAIYNNNAYDGPVWSFTTANQMPDLKVDSVQILGNIYYGSQNTIDVVISNIGNYPTTFKLKFYSSYTSAGEEHFLGEYSNIINPGDNYHVSKIVSMDYLEYLGYIIVKASTDDIESDYNNNFSSKHFDFVDYNYPIDNFNKFDNHLWKYPGLGEQILNSNYNFTVDDNHGFFWSQPNFYTPTGVPKYFNGYVGYGHSLELINPHQKSIFPFTISDNFKVQIPVNYDPLTVSRLIEVYFYSDDSSRYNANAGLSFNTITKSYYLAIHVYKDSSTSNQNFWYGIPVPDGDPTNKEISMKLRFFSKSSPAVDSLIIEASFLYNYNNYYFPLCNVNKLAPLNNQSFEKLIKNNGNKDIFLSGGWYSLFNGTFSDTSEFRKAAKSLATGKSITNFSDYVTTNLTYKSSSKLYVSKTGSDYTGDGSYDFPLATINKAISLTNNSDTIIVLPGLYKENIKYLGKNIVIMSLFGITKDTSYISKTIIDGNYQTTVIDNTNGNSNAELTGFLIQNGKADSGFGGGININNAALRNCLKFIYEFY